MNREKILDLAVELARETGEVPRRDNFCKLVSKHTVNRIFGSYAEMIIAAGLSKSTKDPAFFSIDKIASTNEVILCISDMHHPFVHPDAIDFLKEIKNTFKPTRVVCLGDEIDFHSISFHTHSPELYSPSHELEKAIESLAPIYKLFPKVDVVESNHSSLIYRKQTFHGLPRAVFKSYREILDAPSGWSWHHDLTIRMNNGLDVFFTHGMKANVTLLSQNMAMCAVQGHFHSKFKVEYWANPHERKWGMQIGCLINDKSLAFAYNKTTLERPIIGTGLIINGHPRLQLMELDKHHRWTGKLVG